MRAGVDLAFDVTAEAHLLVEGLLTEPWGRVSPSVYETGRLVVLAPWLAGHRERVSFLLRTQRGDGGWGVLDHSGYQLVPTLSATDALLQQAEASRCIGPEWNAAERGLGRLAQLLGSDRPDNPPVPDMPAIELIVAGLVSSINQRLDELGPAVTARPLRSLSPRDDENLLTLRAAVSAGVEIPEKLRHALEIAGDAARHLAGVTPELTGTVGASPAATAAWLGDHEQPGIEHPARRYLEKAAIQHGGPVPCGLPITVFERGWVLSWLVRAGIPLTVDSQLVAALRSPIGPNGTPASAGLPCDADTTSVALYTLALMDAPHPPDCLFGYERDSHFCTWPGEQGFSATTNAHVLEAFGEYVKRRPDAHLRYRPAIAKASKALLDSQQADGSWLDRWHASPYYATFCAAVALNFFGGRARSRAVGRAVRWLLDTQHPDGGWGYWQGTAEETAYALQTLTLSASGTAGRRPSEIEAPLRKVVARGRAFLLSHAEDPAPLPLWHDKDLYHPTAVVRAAILAALHLTRHVSMR